MTVTDEALVAGAIRSHNSDTTAGDWDAEAARRNLPNDEGALREAHAWAGDGNSSAKSNYSGLHHNVTQDGTVGAANMTACLSGIHALNRADSTIPAGDRGSVYAHLRNHLLAGGRSEESIPALRDATTEASVDRPVTAAIDAPGIDLDVEREASTEDATGTPFRQWKALALIEGTWTGDGRYIEPGVTTWREFPTSLQAQMDTSEGHDRAQNVGRIDAAERIDVSDRIDARTGEPYGEGAQAIVLSGVLDSDEIAQQIATKIDGGFLKGVSVDLSDMEWEEILTDPQGNEISIDDVENGEIDFGDVRVRLRVTSTRIMGLTVTPFPAFEGAFIVLADDDGNEGPRTEAGQPTEAQAAAAIRASMTVPNPRRCLPCETGAITAAAAPVEPPAAWFDDPALDGPTPVTVTDDGRVFGHLATWNTCHTGFDDRCVTPPRSNTGYALFRTGSVRTAEGTTIPVGRLTAGTGHAPTTRSTGALAAANHYDHTGTAVADVAAGEDEHGIWIAGALRPDATDEQIRVLRASPLSGDWRAWGGQLELIAALAVNTPGFPVLRQMVAAGVPQALVAAGPSPSRIPPELDEVRALLPELRASAAREQAARDQEAAALLARADEARGRMRTLTAAALRARVTMDR